MCEIQDFFKGKMQDENKKDRLGYAPFQGWDRE